MQISLREITKLFELACLSSWMHEHLNNWSVKRQPCGEGSTNNLEGFDRVGDTIDKWESFDLKRFYYFKSKFSRKSALKL